MSATFSLKTTPSCNISCSVRAYAVLHLVYSISVFQIFCAVLELMFGVMCNFCLLEMNSGRRILLNRSSHLAFCILGNGILSTNTTRILTLEWAIGLAMATTMTFYSARRMNQPHREREVTLPLDLLQNTSALASSYPRRKRRLQSPVTVLQFPLMSKL